jgi:hypothetical protein
LAADSTAQLSLYPDYVDVAEELALDFDDWFRVVSQDQLSEEQVRALDAIDDHLTAMSRGGADFAEEVWCEEALRDHARWSELRVLAIAALVAFGWPIEVPPRDPRDRGVTYVRGR